MKGFVPTPDATVKMMVEKLFADRTPRPGDRLLDPGCGDGTFIAGVIAHLRALRQPVPRIVGVELDPRRAAVARERFRGLTEVEIREEDFLLSSLSPFDFVIGNPPYVAITGLTADERDRFRTSFETARGRFDLYALFFEQAIRLLGPSGRLVFVTPEKFLYVASARPLRGLLGRLDVRELHFLDEDTFEARTTYPLVTTIEQQRGDHFTLVRSRGGATRSVRLPANAEWWSVVQGVKPTTGGATLEDVSRRISCGVATGADGVYVIDDTDLPDGLRPFSYPTLSGRQIRPDGEVRRSDRLLVPYGETGKLLPESRLGALGAFLRSPSRRAQLERRTCVARKPWYAFHDNFPVADLLSPKLLCKDITQRPFFVIDAEGDVVPRHSVYYIVPRQPWQLAPLAEYLNSPDASRWLRANCQRAANGFLRLQSGVLKRLPVPAELMPTESADRSGVLIPRAVSA